VRASAIHVLFCANTHPPPCPALALAGLARSSCIGTRRGTAPTAARANMCTPPPPPPPRGNLPSRKEGRKGRAPPGYLGSKGRGEGRGGEGREGRLISPVAAGADRRPRVFSCRRRRRRPPAPRLHAARASTGVPARQRPAAAGGSAHRLAGSPGPCQQPCSQQPEQRHCLGVVGGCLAQAPAPAQRLLSAARVLSACARVLSARGTAATARHRRRRAGSSNLGRKERRGGRHQGVSEGRGRGGEGRGGEGRGRKGRTPSLSRRHRRRPPASRLLLSPPPAQNAGPTSSRSPRISRRTWSRPLTWSCWPTPIPGGHVTLNVCAPHRERVSDSARPPGAPALSPCSQPMLSPALSSLYHSLTHLSHSLSLSALSLSALLCALSPSALFATHSLVSALWSLLSLAITLSRLTLSHTRSLWSTLTLGGGGGDLAVRGLDMEGLAGADAPRA